MADSLADAMKKAKVEQAMAQQVETRLDSAWAASAAQPEDDAAAAQFIDVLLAEPMFCPIFEESEDTDAASDDLAPKMVEIEGADTLLLFDTEERLAAYVEEPTAYVALPGRAFFQLVAGQPVQIAVNLDVAPSSAVLGVETVRAIGELAAASDADVSVDGALEILPPDEAPEEMIATLAGRLAEQKALVSEAWLFRANYEAEGAPERNLVLGLLPADGADDPRLRALAQDLGQLGGSFLGGDALDIALFENMDDRLLAAARSAGFDLIGDDAA